MAAARPAQTRRRGHKAANVHSGKVYETTGRAEDRRRDMCDKWFERTEGKGTSTHFASQLNKFVCENTADVDPDLLFTSTAVGKYLANKVEEGNKRVSRKKADAKSKAPASWTIKTPVDLRSNMTTIDVRTLAKLKECREKMQAEYKPRLELPKRVDGEDFWDAQGDMDVDRSRQPSLSPGYKLAVRNALYSSGCSQAKFPHVHATLVYFTIKELGYYVPLDKVVKVVPTDLASIIDFCAEMDDRRLYEETKDLTAAFALSDKGDQKAGTSKNALTHNMVAGYHHPTGTPYLRHMNASQLGRGGPEIAQSIVDDGKRIGIFEWFGSCTDSASDCIKGMVKNMESRFPSFVAAACFLHIMNLVLVNSYLASFGDEERGVCSALRIGYMMSYLHHHFHKEWVDWCHENGHSDIAYIARGAAKTRWWSVVAAFGDCYRNMCEYSLWCEHMAKVLAKTGKGGYYECFVETAGWLRNDKAMTDMAFVLGFCRAFWDDEMVWLQGIAGWQQGLDEKDQKAGFRSAEMPLRVILQRKKLQGLNPWCPNAEYSPAWGPYELERKGLSDEQGAQSEEEAATFLSTALDVHGRHSVRWLTDLVDCSIAHHNVALGVACAAALLSIYDGGDDGDGDAPVVPAKHAHQIIDGGALDLNKVVPLIVQFATAEALREKSVFFTDADTVSDIRTWVAAKGEFKGASGARLRRDMHAKVNGRPMHSHCVERAVNVASCLVQKCGGHEREDRLSAEVSAFINELLVLQREARIEAEQERRGAGHARPWVLDVRGLPRRQKVSVRGKRALYLGVTKVEQKAKTLTVEFVRGAQEAAAKQRKAGADRRSSTEKRAKAAIKGQGAKAAGKANAQETNKAVATAVAAAAASPPKQLLNTLDLRSAKAAPSRAVLALELEARGLGSKVKRAGQQAQNTGEVTSKAQDLIDALKEHYNGAELVPKLTSFEGTKKSRSFAGDDESRAYKKQAVYNTAG